jgi:hypothetical protein
MQALRIRPNLTSIISEFNFLGMKVLKSYFLKSEYRTAGTRELDSISSDFISRATSNRTLGSQFGMIFSHLVEYDNAYRFRVIDICSETTKEKLIANPRKELSRLFDIVCSREVMYPEMKKKYKNLFRMASLILAIPKYKKAFKEALANSNWNNMVYDNIDKYWVCLRTDYNFMGLSYKDRIKLLEENGYSLPVQKEVHI